MLYMSSFFPLSTLQKSDLLKKTHLRTVPPTFRPAKIQPASPSPVLEMSSTEYQNHWEDFQKYIEEVRNFNKGSSNDSSNHETTPLMSDRTGSDTSKNDKNRTSSSNNRDDPRKPCCERDDGSSDNCIVDSTTPRVTPSSTASTSALRPGTIPADQSTARPTDRPAAQQTSPPVAQAAAQSVVPPVIQPTTQPTAQPSAQPTIESTARPTDQLDLEAARPRTATPSPDMGYAVLGQYCFMVFVLFIGILVCAICSNSPLFWLRFAEPYLKGSVVIVMVAIATTIELCFVMPTMETSQAIALVYDANFVLIIAIVTLYFFSFVNLIPMFGLCTPDEVVKWLVELRAKTPGTVEIMHNQTQGDVLSEYAKTVILWLKDHRHNATALFEEMRAFDSK